MIFGIFREVRALIQNRCKKRRWSVTLPWVIAAQIVGLWAEVAAQGQQSPTIDLDQAKSIFQEAKELFATERASFWGRSLDGPTMFVDATSRFVVANQADADGQLQPSAGVFVGQLPQQVMAANTSVDWNGTRWTMLLWPLPADEQTRKVLLAHEAWHRIQGELGFPQSGASNEHLDSLEGRYLLQLEWASVGNSNRGIGIESDKSDFGCITFSGETASDVQGQQPTGARHGAS